MKQQIYRIPEPVHPKNISGKGKKGLLIVINATDKSENLATLQGLVKAINMDIAEDVTIVEWEKKVVDLNSVLNAKDFTTIILLGTPPEQVGFSVLAKKYFFYKMEGFSLLLTDTLTSMNTDKSQKMAFWQNLQKQFL